MRRYVEQHGFPPSMRDIAEAVGLSSISTVAHHIRTLEALGVVHRGAGRSRSYTLQGEWAVKLPEPPPIGQLTAALNALTDYGGACSRLGAAPEAVERFTRASRDLIISVATALATPTGNHTPGGN